MVFAKFTWAEIAVLSRTQSDDLAMTLTHMTDYAVNVTVHHQQLFGVAPRKQAHCVKQPDFTAYNQ
jgi:hypothetical protein